jgi:predicted ribosomally synthesized peptide with nif11-like leader
MSIEQARAFIQKVRGDAALGARVSSLMAAGDAAGLVALGQEHGFAFSATDLKSAGAELSPEDLMAAAGGTGGNWSDLDTTPVERTCA